MLLDSFAYVVWIFLACLRSSIGLKPVDRIVGGKAIDIKMAPYQVSLHYDGGHYCGASIIDTHWILTAAHCFAKDEDPNKFSIRVGSTQHSSGGHMYKVFRQNIHIHKRYRQNGDNDVAAIYIEEPLLSKNGIEKPIKLLPANKTIPVGVVALVSGWGLIKPKNRNAADLLQGAEVPIIDTDDCKEMYSDYTITNTMICAGYEEGGIDACQGDSGGPLALNDVLIGIVSWGVGCAEPGHVGVYTNIAKVRNWIFETTKSVGVNIALSVSKLKQNDDEGTPCKPVKTGAYFARLIRE
ncbi:Trypsin [Popillia japonica]|uniref:trypsin n=1 Tax=Popillia japonica TaxID=7064 RepID=A0AAW1MKJ0_POPJA